MTEYEQLNIGGDIEKLKELGVYYQLDEHNVEIHVDLLPVQLRADPRFTDFDRLGRSYGGKLSARLPPGTRPLMKAGQDETVYKMYATNKSCWVMDKKQKIMRKTEDHGGRMG